MADHYHAIIPGTRSFATLILGDVMTDQQEEDRFNRVEFVRIYGPHEEALMKEQNAKWFEYLKYKGV